MATKHQPGKARNLGVKLDPNTTSRLAAMEEATGVEGVTAARRGLEAILDYFEEHGHISFPLMLVPAKVVRDHTGHATTVIDESLRGLAMVAEPPAPYTTPATRQKKTKGAA